MQKAQRETWDSVKVPGVSTVYYYGLNGAIYYKEDGEKLYCPCSEAYNMMHYRHKLATEYVMDWDWDILFRTNASSYVDKKRLLEFAQSLPLEGCFVSKGSGIMSGAGFFLSRDLVKIANVGIDTHPTPSEDMYIFTMLNRAGYICGDSGDRVEFNHYSDSPERECYHYRCKSDTEDRTKDVKAFHKLFKQLNG